MAHVRFPCPPERSHSQSPDPTARNLVVAREKIAADLGSCLGLPTAPVVVCEPTPGTEFPYFTALSLSCLKAGRQWASGGSVNQDGVAPVLEGLRVFWTWIGDSDHNGHGGNLLYEVRPDCCALLAIDHSYSLCHGNLNDPWGIGACASYGTIGRADCAAATGMMVARILALDWVKVETIVRRLKDLLTQVEQDRILTILKMRRALLSEKLGLGGVV